MQVCQLRLINELNVTTQVVDFLSEPFYSPLNLRIPKATKRTVETADNMFRDGSDLSLIRYNNAVITMQPRMRFVASGQEALEKIEAMRAKIDVILEAARARAIKGYGETVEFWDDTKGFTLVSRVLDGNFDIEEDWDWSNIAQGAVLNSSFSITREPFRTTPTRLYLENLCPNPGFEDVVLDVPSEWTIVNGNLATMTDQKIEGQRCGRFQCTVSPVVDTIVASPEITLTAQDYYVEGWVYQRESDPVILEIYRPLGSTALTPSVNWTATEIPTIADDPRFFRTREHNTWSDYGVNVVPVGFLRKGFIFTATAGTYQVRFRVQTPSAAGDILVDRVYLTPVSNLPYNLASGTALDLSTNTKDTANMKARYFPVGWISFRDIVNHHDDGSTDHVTSVSASVSASASKSPSASTSVSPSASQSKSPSASVSPSASQSKSPSASQSPSASISISPSASASASVSPSTAAVDVFGNHINYVDFYDIPGDLPALCKIRVENTSGANLTQIFAGLRSFGSPAHQVHTSQIGGSGDPEAGQGNKSVFGPLSTTPLALSDTFDLPHSLNGLLNNTGAFRMLVRIKDLATPQGNLRIRTFVQTMTGNTGYNNINITPPGPGATKWALVDTGVQIMPLISPDGSVQNFDSGVDLVFVWRTTGTANVEVDYCQFFPADEFYCAASPTWDNTYFVNLNSLPELPSCYLERFGAVTDVRMRQIPPQATSKPYLAPKRQNRLFISATRALGEHVLTDSMRVAAQVLPRYL